MLCRTAFDLYWLARHVERVDNTARLLDMSLRVSLLPGRIGARRASLGAWELALESLDLSLAYLQHYPVLDAERVLQFLILQAEHPSSMKACMHAARESARAQRGAITAEMYESINSTWLRFRDLDWDHIRSNGLNEFLEWSKRRAAAFRGVTIGTQGRDEGYEFLRLGTFIERADFCIRLLDANFENDAAASEEVDALRYYRLSALLQALSAFENFRKIFSDTLTSARVAELLLLRGDSPRSLASSSSAILKVLRRLTSGKKTEAVRLAGSLAAQTEFARMDEILARGMTAWLTDYLKQLYRLSHEIEREFFAVQELVAV